MSSVSSQKECLRRELRQRRGVIASQDAAAAAMLLVPHALAFFPATIGRDTVVAGYWPMGGEIDPRPLMEVLGERGVTLALPVVDIPSSSLFFRQCPLGPLGSSAESLDQGPFGTCHPCPDCAVVSPDVLLVPVVGFDRRGFRLGQGGGYYDRTLDRLAKDHGRPTATLGLAFQCQKVDALPLESHDYALDAVATEVGLFRYACP